MAPIENRSQKVTTESKVSRKEASQTDKKKQEQQPVPQIVLPEQQWSADVKEHLICHNEKNTIVKFSHEQAGFWKTETIQSIKLFEENL